MRHRSILSKTIHILDHIIDFKSNRIVFTSLQSLILFDEIITDHDSFIQVDNDKITFP